MLNKEKYEKELMDFLLHDKDTLAIKKGKPVSCNCTPCTECDFGNFSSCKNEIRKWLNYEYKEPEIDWDEISLNTPILVKNNENDEWTRRYFAQYIDGKVYAWQNGMTSWSVAYKDEVDTWNYAKLAENVKVPSINWDEVAIDTPIYVKNYKNDRWKKYYFAQYKDEKVYTFTKGLTSWVSNYPNETNILSWQYATIALDAPNIDWNNIPVDTPMLAKLNEHDPCMKLYFAKYDNGKVWTWRYGATSWSIKSINDEMDICSWEYVGSTSTD